MLLGEFPTTDAQRSYPSEGGNHTSETFVGRLVRSGSREFTRRSSCAWLCLAFVVNTFLSMKAFD